MSWGNRRGVDPADIAVGPAVDDVHPAAGAVLEHQAGGAGQVEFLTASLTESRFSDVVASAMMTGL